MSNIPKTGRREFIKKSTQAATLIAALATPAGAVEALKISEQNKNRESGKKKIAIVGTGSRGSQTWGRDLIKQLNDKVELVGLCDINLTRAEFAKTLIDTQAPVYAAKDFALMLKQTNPDYVIVTTTDCFHSQYVVKALEMGCDAICEKPLAIEADQCQDLLNAEVRTGKKIITTFNVRHMAMAEEIKSVVSSGKLGKVISVEFQENLDIHHGADYFRRWHGKSQFSGTLLLTKASHHFDQINWTIDSEPETVQAFGHLSFYGKNNSFRAKNCRSCSFKESCSFYWDITKDQLMMDLYVKGEGEDGYLRDGCVWDNNIDTYDTMTVEVKYKNGVLFSYNMNAFLPYEGQKIVINGEKGRLDVSVNYNQPWEVPAENEFRLTKNFGETKTWLINPGTGTHGGADEKLREMIFSENIPDPMEKMAGSKAGVLASLVGIAARKSIQTGGPVHISELIDFPRTWGW